MAEVIKVFYGREDRIAELNEEIDRVDYKDTSADAEKIDLAYDTIFDYTGELEEKVSDYLAASAEVDAVEEGEEADEARAGLLIARTELVETWALTQAALSKFAWVLRIDGNEAYHRMIDALKNRDTVDMRNL